MNNMIDLYLASTSPRRQALLTQIGVRHLSVAVNIDELAHAEESPSEYVCRLSREKAEAGWQAICQQGLPEKPVLGADTTVVVAGRILGKPANKSEAIDTLSILSGVTHTVLTAVTIVSAGGFHTRLSLSLVEFRPLTHSEMSAYWDTGEPADKAGAYGIQGLGAVFVKSLQGSYSGVMGLPLTETAELLTLCKVPFWQVAE